MRLLLALTTCLTVLSQHAGANQTQVAVRVQTVAFTRLHPTLTYSGSVHARRLADLGFRVGGKVVERPVEIGDHVRAGAVLARLDPTDLDLAVENATNAVASAAADAAQARSDFGRYRALGASSASFIPSEYDRRQAASRMADARLAQAVRQLALQRNQRAYATLSADADGIVTALPVEIGQVVTAGQTVAAVARTGALEVWVEVPENRLAGIAAASADIASWADPERHVSGRVTEIGALADPGTRTYTVKLTLPGAATGWALGMTATVAFDAGHPDSVARLPASALTDRGGAPAVWLLGGDGHAHLRPVRLASFDDDGDIVVTDGLSPGDRVITAGSDLIDPDMHLTAWAGPAR